MLNPIAPTPASSLAQEAAPVVLRDFLSDLVARVTKTEINDRAAGLGCAAPDLRLAEAALRYLALDDGRPWQVAVLGPTQTGKSTVANLLLGQEFAQVSPLAGFTVHAQGFFVRATATGAEVSHGRPWPEGRTWDRPPTPRSALSPTNLNEYSLDAVDSSRLSPRPRGVVIWDTPDFDSLAAANYSQAVLETAALADVHLFVLSKEKYSDLSAWRMLEMLAPLGRPLVICVNKLTPDAEAVVLDSLRRRLAERTPGFVNAAIVPVPNVNDAGPASSDLCAAADHLCESLEDALRAAEASEPASRTRGVAALVRAGWERWTAPLVSEHGALHEWDSSVETAIDRFIADYRRDYLDHPQRYDSFRRAALELLRLLELPHVGGVISGARQAVTWPLRQLFRAGRDWLDQRTTGRRHSESPEDGVLREASEAMIDGLEYGAARRGQNEDSPKVWRALRAALERERGPIREALRAALTRHHAEMAREIAETAGALFEQLQKNPARLATLRAMRAGIDVGGLLLAIKSGGLAPIDAVYAPASLAASSLLVEGAAGLEMSRQAALLKQKQLATLRSELINPVLGQMLQRVRQEAAEQSFGRIDPQRLIKAQAALERFERGTA